MAAGAPGGERVDPLLQVVNVTSGYSQDLDILQDVSITVRPSAITGLIGLNGAGKTTLIKTIYGFLKPRRGRISYQGQEITGSDPHALIGKGIWYLPQDSSLFPYLSVEDNLLLPAVQLKLPRGEREKRLQEAVKLFPVLAASRGKQVGDLSGGQQKMVECAKALIVSPRLLFVDEPTVGLAPKVAVEIYARIREFAGRGMTVFLIDHNVRQLIELASYVYVMNLGRIANEGPQDHFRGELKSQVRQWLGL
jgi:branched-chain amino acid transport system ATP-binding protein